MRVIRGATTIDTNTPTEILAATKELFEEILRQNHLTDSEQLTSVIITVTEDIFATFPAKAVRETPGFEYVPVMSMQEIPVPDSLEMCIRFMVFTTIHKSLKEINHVYLRGAKVLRPDLVNEEDA
ncbi:chorismate mutase [Listeria ivanovii]|uniref:chorismate mutase n=2 Tax=Listeria ivanovii TaxID=1638 RepID=A0ABS1G3H2_LISIV|nr:chorismate mutase [Listeria ivanovii]EFR96416.1 chorismate mutase [Listeria ivanovii FSL F6-596]AIS60328.1 chorismate mutase [Listeria ivanovii subsp. londoniensis]AIS63152.1 chorismate mutase [Listeria ivanovii subsp. londoniensis]MBK1961423.1 chorismate mutase [Listeria ivanovii subsp. londoniensis]MBK1966727.1 chorismate mutase [Listeria ivanovii subsp. londoniensis]